MHTFDQIMLDLKQGKYAPVYVLCHKIAEAS